jgi:hypothetical protein
MRHLDGIKGTFYLSDTEYIALAYLHGKGQPAEQIIYSNVKEIVEHQRYLFQTCGIKDFQQNQNSERYKRE